MLLLLGPFVAFFGTGFFSGFGAVTAEIYPTAIRATAQGFTYNLGRSRERGGAVHGRQARDVAADSASRSRWPARCICSARIAWTWIPETRGRELT